MKKTLSLLFTFIFLFSALTGCAKPKENTQNKENTPSEEYVFKDDLNREIKIKKPNRIATLLGSYADMWLLSGGSGVVASADDAFEDFHLDLDKNTVNLGSAHRPNKELLLSSNPDLVFASSKLSKHLDMKEALESAHIPVAYFDIHSFNDFLRVFQIFTDLTGRKDLFYQYGTEKEKEIGEILKRNEGQKTQKVLVMRASAASIRAKNSEGTMLGNMLADFNTVNIADSDQMLLENLNIESILQMNPDKIFFVETGDDKDGIRKNVEKMFNENPLWKELPCVKNGHVYFMEKELYNLKPNARFVEAYLKLENILYEKNENN